MKACVVVMASSLPVRRNVRPTRATPSQPQAVTAKHFAPQPQRQLLPVHNPAPRADEPATLTLGMICERLGVTLRAEFCADVLHVRPAAVQGKRPGTYTESQFATICRQLVAHVGAMAELYSGETA